MPAEKWEEAEEHYRMSLEYFKSLEDFEGIAKAEQHLKQALKKKQSLRLTILSAKSMVSTTLK